MLGSWNNLSIRNRYLIGSAIIAIALLIPLGRWGFGMWQEAADRKAAMEIEKQFASRQPGANGAAMAGGSGGNGGYGGQGGRGNGGGGRWGGGQGGEQMRARMMEAMTKEVGLTPAQAKQVQAIQASSRPLMRDMFRNPKMSREEKQAQMQQLRAAQQKEMAKILSPDQMAKLDVFRQKMREQWQSRRRERGGGYGGGNNQGNTPGA